MTVRTALPNRSTRFGLVGFLIRFPFLPFAPAGRRVSSASSSDDSRLITSFGAEVDAGLGALRGVSHWRMAVANSTSAALSVAPEAFTPWL